MVPYSRIAVTFLCLFVLSASAEGQPNPEQRRRPGMAARGVPREQASGTARVSGRVTAADGAALRRAQVSLTGQDIGQPRFTLTDHDGRFTIGDLPAGTYAVWASKGGYVRTQYGQQHASAPGARITLNEGQVFDKADIVLERGGVITGLISDEFGEPVADVRVHVLRLRWMNGRRRPVPAGRTNETNDRGEFRIWGLPSGDYLVSARPDALEGMRFGEWVDEQRSRYAPTYFPGTTIAEEAQRVTVTAGQETAGVTFALTPTRTVRITGIALGADGKPMTNGAVMLTPRSTVPFPWVEGRMGDRIASDGSFSIESVTPGEYFVVARGIGRDGRPANETASAIVAVGTEDISNLVLITAKGVRVTGRVTFNETPPAEVIRDLRVYAGPMDPDSFRGAGDASPVSTESAFDLEGLTPGRHALNVIGLPSGWVVESIRVGGIDVSDVGVEVGKQDINGVEIRITNRLTTLLGSVRDGRNEPLRNYVVLVFSSDESHWEQVIARRSSTAAPDQNGVYRIQGLPAGSYYAVALTDVPEDWGNPELLAQLKGQAERFTLSEGESKTLDLALSQ